MQETVMKTIIEAKKALQCQEIADILEMDAIEVEKIVDALKKDNRICSPKASFYEPV